MSFVKLNNGNRQMKIFIGGSLPGVCLWRGAHCGSTGGGFNLALTGCEFRAIFFVSSQ